MDIICKVQLRKYSTPIECTVKDNQTGKDLIEIAKKQFTAPQEAKGHLIVNNVQIDDLKTISELGITSESDIDLHLNLQIEITVFHNLFQSLPLKVNAFDKVLEIAEKIITIYRVPRYSIDLLKLSKILNPQDIFYFAGGRNNDEIRCVLRAQFSIEYKNKMHAFTVDAVETVANVKEEVARQLSIEDDFDLQYEDKIFKQSDDKYCYYGVPQYQQLIIKVLNRITVSVKQDGNITSYKVLRNQTIANFIKYLQKIYQTKSQITLKFGSQILGPQQIFRQLQIKDQSELEAVVHQDKISLSLVNKKRPQLRFIEQIKADCLISDLFQLRQFENKGILFYNSSEKKLELDFKIALEAKREIYYEEIQPSFIIFSIQMKFHNLSTGQEKVASVRSDEQIIQYLDTKGHNVRVNYMGSEIHSEYTFDDIGAKDFGIITYTLLAKIIKISYKDEIHNVEIQFNQKFQELDEHLRSKFNLAAQDKFQFLYKQKEQQLETIILEIYTDDSISIEYKLKKKPIIVQPVKEVQPIHQVQPVEYPKLDIVNLPIQPPISGKYLQLQFYVELFDFLHIEQFETTGTVEDISKYVRNNYGFTENNLIVISKNGVDLENNQKLNTLSEEDLLNVAIQ